LILRDEHEIMAKLGICGRNVGFVQYPEVSMNDFNRKAEDARNKTNQKIADFAERLEKETAEFVAYLNSEVVPAVRTHSTKALRVASQKLAEFADYLERQKRA
jgi:sulfur carrier protein ThiS